MSENINQNGQQQPTTPTPEASGGQGGERTFTQEDVNRIVSERLARERDKAALERAKVDPLQQRETELAAREAAMSCKEYIGSKGYPVALLDVFDTSDADKFKAQVDKLVELFPDIDPTKAAKVPVAVRGGTGNGSASDRIAEAFRPK